MSKHSRRSKPARAVKPTCFQNSSRRITTFFQTGIKLAFQPRSSNKICREGSEKGLAETRARLTPRDARIQLALQPSADKQTKCKEAENPTPRNFAEKELA